MIVFASILMHLILVASLVGAFLCLRLAKIKSNETPILSEKINTAITITFVIASIILLYAFVTCDFSVKYVHDYSDRALPLFYKITAFWGGQAGSLLFWALVLALCSTGFQYTQSYQNLSPKTRQWYLIFYLITIAFFALLLTTHNNPFILLPEIPADGRGLNPLLQHPGMIIHPPLLFFGYAGFTVPACLALAQAMSNAKDAIPSEERWFKSTKIITLFSWLFLTAGIVLGAWWAYMELGWGGYWAWDPVENSSMIPWFLGTATIHFGIIETYRKKVTRIHTFFIGMTHVSAFFATWLVRGNVVESIHAFGAAGVGPTLFIYILASTLIICFVCFGMHNKNSKNLTGLETREGFLITTTVMLTTLSVIIMLATLWPVLSKIVTNNPIGLDASFYNKVCLPIFTVILALLTVCPWLTWTGGITHKKYFSIVIIALIAFIAGLWTLAGVKDPLPLISASLALTSVVSMLLLIAKQKMHRISPALVHIGFALMALGVAFSGPYKIEENVAIKRGGITQVGNFTVELKELYEGREQAGRYTFLEAELIIKKGDTVVGTLAPQRRTYASFPKNAYAEATTLPSLGDEFYATLLGVDDKVQGVMRLSVHPLVNWLWIGGTVMVLAPLFSIYTLWARKEDDEISA